jgi:MarR family transcriptional regulator for hemolysin
VDEDGAWERSATWSLFLTAKALRAYFEDRFADAGSSLATWRTLNEIGRGEWRTQEQLARAMRIEGATLTRHLDRLEADGLIERRRDPDDRRASLVEATAAGRRLHARLRKVAEAADADLWSGTSERDLARLRAVLGAVRDNVARMAAQRAPESGAERR